MKLFRLTLFIALSIMALAACNRRGETSVDVNPQGGIDITTTLTEADVNALISEALAQGENPLLRDPQVDLQPGLIVISGEHDRRDGQGRVSGSITVAIAVQNGAIVVQATAINIEGFDASDERLAEFNERLAQIFTRRAESGNSLISVRSVTVSDGSLVIVINARRQ